MKLLAVSLVIGAAAIGVAAPTFAADLIIEEPTQVGIVDVSGTWDRPYVGIFGGYGSGTYEGDNDFSEDFDGWLLGVNLGTNVTVSDGIVAGVVGDIAWADMSFFADGTFSVDWTASLRGRLGFDAGAFLPYLTAGLAVAGTTIEDGPSDSATHFGWTVGAGVEFAATDELSVDLLYRYSDYGDATYFDSFDAGFSTHQVTVGLNWSF